MGWGAAAVAILQLSAPVPSGAVADWGWFSTVSTGSEWRVTQGKGDVSISGGRFVATLRDADPPQFARLTLRGSMLRGVVKARVTVESSDVPEFQVSGRFRRLCWEAKGGREILILTNGLDVIGLVRELSPSVPCKLVA
jgi:hypothetical protein